MAEPATAPRAARRSPKPAVRARLPVSIRWGVPALLLGYLAFLGYGTWRDSFAYLDLADLEGAAIAEATVELFAHDESAAAPSPTEKLGELAFTGQTLSFDREELPDTVLMRFTAPGYGIGYGVLHAAERLKVRLGPPQSATGRVLFAGKEPAAGARVEVFGGGPHGVKISETFAGPDGSFVIEGFSSTISTLHLRVFHAGHTVVSHDWVVQGGRDIDLRLQPTKLTEGRLVLPAGLPPTPLRLRIYSLPGAETEVAADGRFRFDGLPSPPFRLRVLVVGLSDEWTHPLTLVEAGERGVEIPIVRSASVSGRVINRLGRPVARAAVVHDHGPNGQQVALCDERGTFTIGRLPRGQIDLAAESFSRRRIQQGTYRVTVDEGAAVRGISIAIE